MVFDIFAKNTDTNAINTFLYIMINSQQYYEGMYPTNRNPNLSFRSSEARLFRFLNRMKNKIHGTPIPQTKSAGMDTRVIYHMCSQFQQRISCSSVSHHSFGSISVQENSAIIVLTTVGCNRRRTIIIVETSCLFR